MAEEYGAFLAPDKARSESATVLEEGVGLDDDRRTYFSIDQPPMQAAPAPVARHETVSSPAADVEQESVGGLSPVGEDEYDFEDVSEEGADDDDSSSVFDVPRAKIRRPRFPDQFTGFQWCRRRQKIIEKMRGEPLPRQIKHTDDPEEYAVYLVTEEQDAYVESTTRWLTQALMGSSGAMEAASEMMRKKFPKAPVPNLSGLTDNQLGVLEEYEVLFMEMDGTVGERFRQMDPMLRMFLLFMFQVVSTAFINAKMGEVAGAASGREEGAAGGMQNVLSMAQKLSADVLKDGGKAGSSAGGALGGLDLGGLMSSFAPILESLSGKPAASAGQPASAVPVIEQDDASSEIVDVMEVPQQTFTPAESPALSRASNIEEVAIADEAEDVVGEAPPRMDASVADTDSEGSFELSAAPAQQSRTIDIADYE